MRVTILTSQNVSISHGYVKPLTHNTSVINDITIMGVVEITVVLFM